MYIICTDTYRLSVIAVHALYISPSHPRSHNPNPHPHSFVYAACQYLSEEKPATTITTDDDDDDTGTVNGVSMVAYDFYNASQPFLPVGDDDGVSDYEVLCFVACFGIHRRALFFGGGYLCMGRFHPGSGRI